MVAFARTAWTNVGLVPYGIAPKRKPRFEVLGAFTDSRRLYISGYCTTTCRLSVKGGRVTKEASSTASIGL